MNVRKGKPGRPRRWIKRLAIVTAATLATTLAAGAVLWQMSPFPLERLRDWPASPRITDRSGQTMLERVGADGQWRIPVKLADISPHVVAATIAVEDRRFYSHCGVDAAAVLRAVGQNVQRLRTHSGASTLTMQVCRMMDDRPRTFAAKAIESFRALQLERLCTKDQILEMYLNIAPYGRNIRGIEAASLGYFGKHAKDLSLAEAATLAGLPQSPSRYRPDRQGVAAQRYKVVLARMIESGAITPQQAQQAHAEPPSARLLPHMVQAPHAAWLALAQRPRGGRTTIDLSLQAELERLCTEHATALPEGSDVAAVVIDIATGDVLALVGSLDASRAVNGQVNGVTAWRSPGSALKPFVYAAAFEARRLAPQSTVYDVPIHRAGWSPDNFDKTFRGPLPAADALRRSLNIPAILVAEGVGLTRCCGVLEAAGVHLPSGAAARGGLAIVTGAVEVRLLDLTAAYATLGRGGRYVAPRLLADAVSLPARPAIDVDVCRSMDEILSSRQRRPGGMEQFAPDQVPWFMWKTGTSSARRDAVAAGHNGRLAVGVWVGRFSGEGDGAFVGGVAAEPLLAGIFSLSSVRVDVDPPPAGDWAVRFPLPPPPQAATDLKIMYPHDGAVFLALDREAVVQPLVNHDQGLCWFLNDLVIDSSVAQRLVLPRGSYCLRCADSGGNSSAVRFVVK